MRFLILILCSLGSALAHSDGETGKDLANLFTSGKYDEALHELQTHPNESTEYYYNLGTVYLRMNQAGLARAYLEKANTLSPRDTDVRRNLSLAEREWGRVIGEDRLDLASTPLESIADRVPLDELRGTIGLLGLLVAGLWLRAYLRTRNLKRTLFQPGGLLGLAGLLITLALYGAERRADACPPAFTLESSVVRTGPGDRFVQVSTLETGSKIRILGPSAAAESPQHETWRQIRYSRDGIGWIKASNLLLL